MDEFQPVVKKYDAATAGQIRAAVQQHPHVGYAFAVSDTRLLMAMVTNHSCPFYRLDMNLFVGPMPREAFRRFLSDELAQGGLGITVRDPQSGEPPPESPLELILGLAEEVPYNVQVPWTVLFTATL